MTPDPNQSPAGPALLVRTPDAERSLSAGRSYVVGRDPQSDIFVNDSRVSWRHAVLRMDGTTWLFEDVGSTNGTFQGRDRVQRITISGPCAIRLGHPDDGPAVSLSVTAPVKVAEAAGAQGPAPTRYAQGPPAQAAHPAVPRLPGEYGVGRGNGGAVPAGVAAAGQPGGPVIPPPRLSVERMPSAVMRLPTALLRIGRAADNQVVVADLSVSRYHAELRKEPTGGYMIVDLGSHNGTFVNGQRIGSAPVTERDVIAIGPATFRLVGEELQEFLDTGDISFIAKDLTVTLPSGRVILDHVSFPLGERCLMGVIGPSGAGKSTLLGALTGMAPANQGSVLYDDRDLYAHYAELRHRIGLVPQENILHTQLTAIRGLSYAAELRFPRDTSKAERNHRIDEVIDELALTRHANTKTAAMSGGQQKRVNVALELLTKPSLLFLDEPTSGLDPGLDKSVMQLCADLAHDGRTIIVVTHSVLNLDLCDRLLVLVPGGRIAYFGAPQEGLKHFKQPGWAEVFQAFEAEPDRDWAAEYRNSVYYQQYVAPGMEPAGAIHHRAAQPATAAPKSSNRLAQTMTLIRRYSAVLGSDRGFLILLAVSVIGLGALVQFFPLSGGFIGGPTHPNANATSDLLILMICASFAGALNSIRELVKERPIYARERSAGLSPGAYLASKLVVLGVISAVQAFLLAGIGLFGKHFPLGGSAGLPPILEIAIATALVAMVSMTLGLVVSSAVSTSERAMPLVFVIVMLQVVMTGALLPINGKPGLEQIAWLTPSRWGFAAAGSTVNMNVIDGGRIGIGHYIDPIWQHTSHVWTVDVGAMAGLFVLYSLIAWWRLVKLGPLKRGA